MSCVSTTTIMTSHSTKVLIVGAGPTGLLSSILLSRFKIPHLLVEQREAILQAPAAHVINSRTLEIYRQAGLPMDDLFALNRHPGSRFVTWLRRPGETVLGQYDMASDVQGIANRAKTTQEPVLNISQHLLEKFLLDYASKSPFADIRFGTKWVQFQDGDTRHSQLTKVSGSEGSQGSISVEADYVLAADGAGSSVSRVLKITKTGPDSVATMLNLSCEVDMSEIACDGTLLYWLMDPDMPGTIIVHDPEKLAVFMLPISTPYESYEDFDDARCKKLLDAVFQGRPYKLIHKGVWKMTAQVADAFRQGNVFLIGDSAHRFPPTGGLGLNTGVGDAHNIVWKLAAVLAPHPDISEAQKESLLESYELERKPVAEMNTKVSLRNGQKMLEVVQAIGLDPSKAYLVPKAMNSPFIRILPDVLKRGIRNMLLQPAKSAVKAAAASDQSGENIRAVVARSVANQREHFSALGLELGYVYRAGTAVAPEAKLTPEDDVSTYNQVAAAGARLPHAVISVAGREQSTHDLIDYQRFTLFKRPTANGATTASDQATFNFPINEIDISEKNFSKSAATIAEAFDLEPGGWLLVRPDGHVMSHSGRVSEHANSRC